MALRHVSAPHAVSAAQLGRWGHLRNLGARSGAWAGAAGNIAGQHAKSTAHGARCIWVAPTPIKAAHTRKQGRAAAAPRSGGLQPHPSGRSCATRTCANEPLCTGPMLGKSSVGHRRVPLKATPWKGSSTSRCNAVPVAVHPIQVTCLPCWGAPGSCHADLLLSCFRYAQMPCAPWPSLVQPTRLASPSP